MFPFAGFVLFYQVQKYFIALNLSSSECSHTDPLFISGEQEKVASWDSYD